MKRLVLFIALCVMGIGAHAQTMQEKLYYTCKVWGFVKYYHSEVSVCNVNWDSVLLDVLPDVRAASNSTEFNDALMRMLNAAGPMAIAPGSLPDTLPIELKRNRDWTFIANPALRADVQAKLTIIKNNFRPHAGCYVVNNPSPVTMTPGWLIFPRDSAGLDMNTTITYPSVDQRLLMFFKYWNIIRYFNPYNYVLDTPWDTTLINYAKQIADVTNASSLYFLYMRIAAKLDDAHVYGTTYSPSQQAIPGFFRPNIKLKYIGGQYTVVNSLEPNIYKGDVIISIDGKTTAQWEDSLKQYYSAGNLSVLRRIVCGNLLGRRTLGTMELLVVKDSVGVEHTHSVSCVSPVTNLTFHNAIFYPNDSLEDISWTTMPCDIGYVNMGVIVNSQVDAMYSDLKDKEAIIFDLRQYPNQTLGTILNKLFSTSHQYSKSIRPQVNYPGTYYWNHNFTSSFSTMPYTGKVIVLINEETQSQGEFTCMGFEPFANVIKVGSQTAGADGNISTWKISQDINAGFTTLGIFYPNGDSTQRIGIVPDTVVYPTIAGIRRHRDEVLEKALKIAGCNIFPPITSTVAEKHTYQTNASIYPNPANEAVTVRVENVESEITLSVIDIYGRVLMQEHLVGCHDAVSSNLNIEHLVAGMYFLKVESNSGQLTTLKFVKE